MHLAHKGFTVEVYKMQLLFSSSSIYIDTLEDKGKTVIIKVSVFIILRKSNIRLTGRLIGQIIKSANRFTSITCTRGFPYLGIDKDVQCALKNCFKPNVDRSNTICSVYKCLQV